MSEVSTAAGPKLCKTASKILTANHEIFAGCLFLKLNGKCIEIEFT
jgi:hypothetical protein